MAGMKLFAEEVEAVLNNHPQVRENRVYGMAHHRLGESRWLRSWPGIQPRHPIRGNCPTIVRNA